MNNTEKYTDEDWEKIALLLSGETTESIDDLKRFKEEDHFSTEKQWNEMRKIGNNNKVDVDKAWNKIYSRIEDDGLLSKTVVFDNRFRMRTFIRIAAITLIVIGLGSTILYLNNSGAFTPKIIVTANSTERNKEVTLPDGSIVHLNRNSKLSYNKYPGKSSRNVILKGEAFFDVKRDLSKPFIIDAGKAIVKVLGTTFSVLTNNSDNAVEVFVKTGSVILTDSSGTRNLVLDPGFIGTMDSMSSTKTVNENPNYLSWNTDLLVFEKKSFSIWYFSWIYK